ncbi:MAG: glycosyltransferase [Thermodesulfobacteriota bacterium]|nr:glycosyltransferase [Thermodesulfobacteriota bacterium]
MSISKRLVIIAPFWGNPEHVGCYRVDRFVRWLREKSIHIVLVRAGIRDMFQESPSLTEITIRDPLSLYGRRTHRGGKLSGRSPNRARRFLSRLLFCPDAGVVWSMRAARHPLVLKATGHAFAVLSSSPPESAHVGAASLAKRLGIELIVDMRDGWLDEPLKPLLQKSRFVRWREGRLERSILQQAAGIFVTSDNWKSLLERRLPFAKDKTTVLTNACPRIALREKDKITERPSFDGLVILYAGRFTGSRNEQTVDKLLGPLAMNLPSCDISGKVELVGRFDPEDLTQIKDWQARFEEFGWCIEAMAHVPREQIIERLQQADGLLLLSASYPVIPCKLFDYLVTKKPILCTTLPGSSVWKMKGKLPQLFVGDYSMPDNCRGVVNDFVFACASGKFRYEIPTEFTEDRLKETFLSRI